MQYTKADQLGKKKPTQTTINRKANRKLEKLKIEKDVRHCELCSSQGIGNAHRHPRDWYKGKKIALWDYDQVLFLCQKDHDKMDDRSQTTEAEKEEIFIRLRGK